MQSPRVSVPARSSLRLLALLVDESGEHASPAEVSTLTINARRTTAEGTTSTLAEILDAFEVMVYPPETSSTRALYNFRFDTPPDALPEPGEYVFTVQAVIGGSATISADVFPVLVTAAE